MARLPPLIESLLRADAYPHLAPGVRLIQTHISSVLLAGKFAYKIKKPVNFGFLDFSTLARRRYYCRQEVVLNSRLCSDTYLGVVPIIERDGRYVIGGNGRPVEYAVQMRRLPEDRMMDRLLPQGGVTAEMIQRLAAKLADFHGRAETSPRIAEYGDWAVRFAWAENFRQWAPFIGRALSAEQDRILRAYGEAFFARKRTALERRVRELRIRECHSDLRSDAVCFTNGICIFDCVEFNRRIRLVDVARDVGFLSMDLDYRGYEDLAQNFVRSYVDASGDGELREIIEFYQCYNACVRGKVESFLLAQPEVPEARKRAAQRDARRYFALARRYAASLPPAMLIITCGLPATGKSTVARRLAEQAGFDVLSSDIIRKRLAGIAESEHRYEEYEAGIYGRDFTEKAYTALLRQARDALQSGRTVVLDASFTRRAYRRAAVSLAKETGAQFACLSFEASDRVVRRRLVRREKRGRDPSDARWKVYVGQKRRFQRPSEIPGERLIPITGRRPLDAPLAPVLARLRTLSPISLRQVRTPRRPVVTSDPSR